MFLDFLLASSQRNFWEGPHARNAPGNVAGCLWPLQAMPTQHSSKRLVYVREEREREHIESCKHQVRVTDGLQAVMGRGNGAPSERGQGRSGCMQSVHVVWHCVWRLHASMLSVAA